MVIPYDLDAINFPFWIFFIEQVSSCQEEIGRVFPYVVSKQFKAAAKIVIASD